MIDIFTGILYFILIVLSSVVIFAAIHNIYTGDKD